MFGATDLAHYAAANVFVDAFAEARRAEGRPVVSISWGTWEKIRGSDEQQRLIDRGGLKIMPAARTLNAFTQLRGAGAAHLVFAEIDWRTLKSLYELKRARPFFDQVGRLADQVGIWPTRSAARLRPVRRRRRRRPSASSTACRRPGPPSAAWSCWDTCGSKRRRSSAFS